MRRLALSLVALSCLGLSAAGAQELVKSAQKAEEQLKAGRHLEAMTTMEGAIDALWKASPLVFRKALFVAEPPGGFGIYSARENDVFQSGQDLIVYAEPVGFDWRRTGDVFRTDLAVDAKLMAKDGKELWSKEDFGKMEVGSRLKNHEFMLKLTYGFKNIPAGDYVIVTTVRDKVSGKSGAFSLPFRIRG